MWLLWSLNQVELDCHDVTGEHPETVMTLAVSRFWVTCMDKHGKMWEFAEEMFDYLTTWSLEGGPKVISPVGVRVVT
jgi:hypothetical protein